MRIWNRKSHMAFKLNRVTFPVRLGRQFSIPVSCLPNFVSNILSLINESQILL